MKSGLFYVMVAAVTGGLFGTFSQEAAAADYYKILSREPMARGAAIVNTVTSYPVMIQGATSPCLTENVVSYPVAVQTTATPCPAPLLQTNVISQPVVMESRVISTPVLLERTTTVRPKRFLQFDLEFGGL